MALQTTAVSLIQDIQTIGWPSGKQEMGSYSIPDKTSSTWINELNVKGKTFSSNSRKYLSDLRVDMDFFSLIDVIF